MKRFVCIALFLLFVLSACNEATEEISLQESGAQETTVEGSSINPEQSEAEPSFADYKADDARMNKYAYDVNGLLNNVDLEKYSYSENLLAIGGMKSKFSFEEAFAVLELCRYTAKAQGWHEKDFLTTEAEEQGGSNAEDFERNGLMCYDINTAESDEDSAIGPMIDCNENATYFTWLHRELAPKISELCGKRFTETPTEEDFKTAAKNFFDTYFPYYVTGTYSNVYLDTEKEKATVVLYQVGYCLDQDYPDLDGGSYYPISASLEFRFGKDELALANNGEKAILHEASFYYNFNNYDVIHTRKKVIAPSDAWKEAQNGGLYQSEEGVVFEHNSLFWHSYYISYRTYNGYFQPCYTFICSQDGKGVFTLIAPALEDMLETVFADKEKTPPPKETEAAPIFIWDTEDEYYTDPIFIGGTNSEGFHTPDEFIYNGMHIDSMYYRPIYTNAVRSGEKLAFYDQRGYRFEALSGISVCFTNEVLPLRLVANKPLADKKPKRRFLIGSYESADIFPEKIVYSDGKTVIDLDCDGSDEILTAKTEKKPDSITGVTITLESGGKQYTVREFELYGSKYEKFDYELFFADIDSDGEYEIIAYYMFNNGHETFITVYDTTESGISELYTQTVHYLN